MKTRSGVGGDGCVSGVDSVSGVFGGIQYRGVQRCAAFVLSATMLLVSAACGIGTYNEGDSDPTKLFDLSTVAEDRVLVSQVPSSIAQDGVLTVATDPTYAPAEFLAADGHTIQGYDADLARAIGKVLGLETTVESATFNSIIPATGTKYDIGISSFTITPERAESVNFVSYFKAGMTYSVLKGNPRGFSVDDACGASVAVETGTPEQTQIEADSAECVKNGKSAISELPFAEQADATMAVVTGRADAMFADSPVAGYALTQTGGQVDRLGGDQQIALQGVTVAKDDTAATKLIQQVVQKLIDDGTYMKILQFWGVESCAVEQAEINPKSE